jgi:hypothetical protein
VEAVRHGGTAVPAPRGYIYMGAESDLFVSSAAYEILMLNLLPLAD